MESNDPAAAAREITLRRAPAGLPDPNLQPPTVAETGDPFAALRIVHFLASVERGRPLSVAGIAAALDARHLDWAFPPRVVADVILQLQVNWMADYRNSSGIVIEDGPAGAVVTIEDSSRVDPWIVGQAQQQAAACREALLDFSRREGRGSEG